MNFKSDAGPTLFSLLFWFGIACQGVLALAVAKPWLTGDSELYIGLARSIDQGFYGWVREGSIQPDALRPPGYPIILWLLLHRLQLSVAVVVILQIGMYVSSVLLIDRWIRREGFSTAPFRLLAPIYPFGAIYCGFVMTEAWAMLALTATAWLISADRLSKSRLILAGVVMGVASLIRSDLILLPLFVAMLVIVRDWRSASVLAMARRALLPLLAAAIIVAPYALWNLRHFDRPSPIPVASAVGNSLYLATWQGEVPLDDLNALYGGVVTTRVDQVGLAEEMRRLNASIGADQLTPPFNPGSYPTEAMQMRSSETFGQAARQRMNAFPMSYVRHVTGNLWALWNTSAYPDSVPVLGRVGLTLVSGLVCIAGLIGLFVAIRSGHPIAAAGLVLIYPMLIHLPLHSEARYTAAVRPLLLMFASIAVLWLVKCYRERRWQLGRSQASG